MSRVGHAPGLDPSFRLETYMHARTQRSSIVLLTVCGLMVCTTQSRSAVSDPLPDCVSKSDWSSI